MKDSQKGAHPGSAQGGPPGASHSVVTDYRQRINLAARFIRQHAFRSLTISEVAEIANFSPFHFHRIFTAFTGETIFEYLTRHRMMKAVELLMAGHGSSHIALETGYQTTAAFTKTFKKTYGSSLTVYKEKNKGTRLSFVPGGANKVAGHTGGGRSTDLPHPQRPPPTCPSFSCAGKAGSTRYSYTYSINQGHHHMRKITLLIIFYLLAGRQLQAQFTIDTSTYLINNAGIYSIIIAKNDQVLYKKYYNHHTEDSLFNDQSLTKSIGSILIGIAIDKGYIRSLDEKIAVFFPELKADSDKRKQDITLRQVMCQASGLYHENIMKLSAYLALPDPSGFVLSQPLVSEPGKVFHYNNAASHLLSLILTKTTGMDTRSFAKKFLFDPLGINKFEWAKMRDGYYDGGGLLSIRMRSEDMTRIGLLLLNGGVYKGRQIVSAQWVTSLLHPDLSFPTEWGFEKSTYALCFYHTEYKGTAITYGMGWGGQFLILIPSLHAVVVTNENIEDRHAIQQSITFITRIFPLIYDQLHYL